MALSIRKKVEGSLRGEETGPAARAFFYGASVLYGAGVGLRLALYGAGVLKQKALPCKVISVGNITAGGTGKTPVTMFIAGLLRSRGKKVVVLSRGYKSEAKGVTVVSEGQGPLIGADGAGDEPFLMAERLSGVPVIVGADRLETGGFAIKRWSPDFIILDDGFQHIRLKRDLDLVLVDSEQGFGNCYLLPRGILREPLAGIKRADLALVKGQRLDGRHKKALDDAGVRAVYFSYRPSALYAIPDNSVKDLTYLTGRKIAALSGVANPVSFLKTLSALGASVEKEMIYPDHHAYSSSDIDEIKKGLNGVEALILTEKDAVKLKGMTGLPCPAYALRIEVELADIEGFKKLLASRFPGVF